tara:strand:- start:730 stop:1008 length:279 start_codon:yes stop_codon:yes gene_type:complete
MENKMRNQMEKESMFNTPDYEALDYLFNTIMKYIYKPNDFDKPYAIISAMQIKNFIVTNTPTDGCDDCAYLSMDTDAVVNVCPECAEERGLT